MHSIGDLVAAYTVNNYLVFGVITEIDEYNKVFFVTWFMGNEEIEQHYNNANITALKENLADQLKR
jgi:hypothetical protein